MCRRSYCCNVAATNISALTLKNRQDRHTPDQCFTASCDGHGQNNKPATINLSDKADLMTLNNASRLLQAFNTCRDNRQRLFLNIGKLLNCRLNITHTLLVRWLQLLSKTTHAEVQLPYGTHRTHPLQLSRLWGPIWTPPTFAAIFVIFRWALWEGKCKGKTDRKVNGWITTTGYCEHDTTRDAVLTCARKPTKVSLIYRMEIQRYREENFKDIGYRYPVWTPVVHSNFSAVVEPMNTSHTLSTPQQFVGFPVKQFYQTGTKQSYILQNQNENYFLYQHFGSGSAVFIGTDFWFWTSVE